MGPSKRRNSPNDDGSDAMRRRAVRGRNGFMSKLSTVVVGNVGRRRRRRRRKEMKMNRRLPTQNLLRFTWILQRN